MDVTLTSTQQRVFSSKANIVEWSADFCVGKTFLAKVKLLEHLLTNAGAAGFYVLRTGTALSHIMQSRNADSFYKMFSPYATYNETTRTFKFESGSSLFLRALDDSDAGVRPDILVIDGLTATSDFGVLPRQSSKDQTFIFRTSVDNCLKETTFLKQEKNPYLVN